MKEAIVKVRREDVIWNYVGTVFSMCSNFILLPLLLLFLTSEQIGLWYVFVAISGFSQLLEFGFTSTLSRNILYCLSGAQSLSKTGLADHGDIGIDGVNWHLFRVVLKTSRIIYAVIGIIAFILASTLGSFYVSTVTGEFSISWSLLSWIVFDFSIFTNLYFLYKLTFLRGIGDVAGENRAKTVARLGQLILTAALLFCGFQLLAAAIGFFAYSLFLMVIAGHAFNSNSMITLGIASDKQSIGKQEMIDVLGSVAFVASRDGIVSVAWYGATQATSLICSAFLGLAQNATYSVMLQIATAICNLGGAYIRSCFPMYQSAFVTGDATTQRRIIERGMSCYVLTCLIGTAVVALCLPVFTIIKSDFICDRALFACLSLYLILLNQHSLFCNIIVNTNEIPYFKAYIISSVVGIILTCLLCGTFNLGVWGIILGQAIPQLVYNNWYWPSFVLRRIGITYPQMLKTGSVWWLQGIAKRFASLNA